MSEENSKKQSSEKASAKQTKNESVEAGKSLNMILQAFQVASEATDTIVFIFDSKRQSIFVSDTTAGQWGVLTEQKGVPYEVAESDIVPEESKAEYIRLHEQIMSGELRAKGKVSLKDAAGNVGYYELTLQALLDDYAKPTGKAAGVYKNITEYQESYKHQYAMTKALSEGIASVYYIDFDEDTFIVEQLSARMRSPITSFIKQQQKCFSTTIASYCRIFVHADDCERMLYELSNETILERLREKHSYYIQYRVKSNDEDYGYFEIHISEASESPDEHKAFMSFRCIDEQKEKEIEQQKALAAAYEETKVYARRAHENLDIINDIIGSGLWYMEFDERGRMDHCFWSDTFRSMLGFEDKKDFPDTLEAWSDRLHPEDCDRTIETFRNCIAGKGSYDVRYRLKKRDGTYTWYRSVGKVVRYANDMPRLFVGTFVDITEQREKERLRSIISSVVSVYFASWVINADKNEISEISVPEYGFPVSNHGLNTATRAMEVLVQKFVSSDDDKIRMSRFLDVDTISERVRGQSLIATEYFGTVNGWCSANIIPVSRNASGNIEEYVLAVRTVDEEKQTEIKVKQALEDAYEAANRANAAKSNFLSNMSHDIRTPMNAIVGMTAIACAHLDDRERVLDCLSKITVSSKHLLGIINEVLDMSKIESGKLNLNMEDFDLKKLIDNLLAMSRPQIEAKGHELTVNIHGVEHELVTGDSQRIQQAFMNLMSNAIKYTPEGGKINLTITEKPTGKSKVGCFEFVFEDNGIGMSEEYQKHLFEPFVRAADFRVQGQQGTGLGMPITRNIVRMMNGDILVESVLGQGSKFTVTIFLQLQDMQAENDYNTLSGLTVLVADDDPAACEGACSILKELGMKGEWVMTGQEALTRVKRRHAAGEDYFAVILDLKMPEMDGIETARAIREAAGDEIGIIISAYDWLDAEADARAAGANAFISKPMFKSRMVHTFKRIIAHSDDSESIDTTVEKIGEYDFGGKRVLLVEDNDLNAEIAGEILKMVHIDVEFAIDGQEALDRLNRVEDGYYDLIFMDIQMPGMNGYDTTRAIRAADREYFKTVPIVAMTANAFAEDVEEARETGMNEHIAKPIDIGQLMSVLKNCLL